MKFLFLIFILLILAKPSLASSSDSMSVIKIQNFKPEINKITLMENNLFSQDEFSVSSELPIELLIDINDNNGYKDIISVRFKIIDINNSSNYIIGEDFLYPELKQHYLTNAIYSYKFELLPSYKQSTYQVYLEVEDSKDIVIATKEFIIKNKNPAITGFVIRDLFSINLSDIFSKLLSLFS